MQKTQENGKGIISFIIIVAITAAVVAGGYLFFSGYFNKDKESGLVIDKDNTEIIVEKRDLKEINDRLDELDIDLDDILNELEF